MNDRRLLELAISGLEAQRDRIEEELAQLRRRAGGGSKSVTSAKKGRRRGRKRTAAEKKAHSERMKAIWAARKRGKK
jgi:predicted  nucleic acid-binding Zn-ribbon protein